MAPLRRWGTAHGATRPIPYPLYPMSNGKALVTHTTIAVALLGLVAVACDASFGGDDSGVAVSTTTSVDFVSFSPPPAGSVVGDVRFRPGDRVASIVAGSPTGTVFVFSPGVYLGVSIQPRSGQKFLGEAGAVLDGNGAKFAFRSAGPNVTVDGLEITDYRPSSKEGVIQAEPGARNWVVANNEIHHNAEIGVKGAAEWRILGNNIHHNGRYGLIAAGASILIEGNEIAFNSTDYGATGDSGGTKFVHTENLVLRGNYVHDNYGNGLWADINNRGYMIEGNRVVGNQWSGIYVEISCGGTVRNNRLERNGYGDSYPNWMTGAGIVVDNSPDVEVYGNTLVNNAKGLGAIHGDRDGSAVTKCVAELRNLYVHHNTVTQSSDAAAGLDAQSDRDRVWSSWNNRFENNTYNVGNGDQFRWEGQWITLSEWRTAGNN